MYIVVLLCHLLREVGAGSRSKVAAAEHRLTRSQAPRAQAQLVPPSDTADLPVPRPTPTTEQSLRQPPAHSLPYTRVSAPSLPPTPFHGSACWPPACVSVCVRLCVYVCWRERVRPQSIDIHSPLFLITIASSLHFIPRCVLVG